MIMRDNEKHPLVKKNNIIQLNIVYYGQWPKLYEWNVQKL